MTNITRITIHSFKQFDEFTMRCFGANVLVGPNNAGKSTILDAIRIVAACNAHARRTKAQRESHGSDGVCASYTLPNSNMPIPPANLVKDYGDQSAELRVEFGKLVTFVVLLKQDAAVRFYVVADTIPQTPAEYRRQVPIEIRIVPPLAALETEEKYVADATVVRNRWTRLASRNFRNIVLRMDDADFKQLHELVEYGFPDVTLKKPEVVFISDNRVIIFFEQRRIPRELALSGFGFQVWLQMMLHMANATKRAILVLDEPDIYLHPELQKRVLHLSEARFAQFFIATHSPEIINEAERNSVVSIDAQKERATRVNSTKALRGIHAYIGSSENAEFAKIARSKRVVFFEGKDRRLLRRFANRLNRFDFLNDSRTIFLEAGGFSQWRRVKEVSWAFEKIFALEKSTFALFDRDYRSDQEITEFLQNITQENLLVKVLRRKEIENYTLSADSLTNSIRELAVIRSLCLSEDEVRDVVESAFQNLKAETEASLQADYSRFVMRKGNAGDIKHILAAANAYFAGKWQTWEGRLEIVSGKQFIRDISTRLQASHGLSVSATDLLVQIPREQIDGELIGILEEAENFFENC